MSAWYCRNRSKTCNAIAKGSHWLPFFYRLYCSPNITQ
ncbi:hypothetical protein [Phage ST231]|nr:hypothetical protein [Phage ST231]